MKTLPALVDEFRTAHPGTLDPEACRDACVPLSDAFAALLVSEGIEAQVISGIEMGEVAWFPGEQVVLNGHFAVQAGDVVYDWTARQFEAASEVPLVVPVSRWRERWREPGAVT